MSSSVERIKAQIQALEEELALIRPTSWNHQRINDRRHMIELLDMQLQRIERMHATFLETQAVLLARSLEVFGRTHGH